MLERQSRIAIVASLFWMAIATFVILGTHGEAMAKADFTEPAVAPASEWQALPAVEVEMDVRLQKVAQC